MYAIIVQPFVESSERTKQLEEEATAYVKSLGYEILNFTSDDLIDIMKRSCNADFSAYPFVIGATCMLASMAGTICFWEGWQNHSECQDIFQIAFKYGLNIITKPET